MAKEMYFVDDNGGNWQPLYQGELNSSSEHLQAAAYYNTMEQTASQFESRLSSMGSMYNSSREISPPLSCSYNNNSAKTSCYSTPLNSPPKLNLRAVSLNAHRGVAPLPSDPGFAERAAMNSCFGHLDLPYRCLKKLGSGNLSRVSSSKSMRCGASSAAAADEEEFSSISDKIPGENATNAKKRKAIANNKAKEKVVKEDYYDAKRSKASEKNGEKAKNNQKQNNNSSKPPEPPKDYIHVRARRGQATDNHSLAERVRREKISERMKVLQDLVPGCSKVTGKAVMLDEIINYVQSLQRQVEFLSMKLATVNFDSNMEAFLSKEGLQPHASLPQTAHPFELSQAACQFVKLQKLGFIQNVVANGTDVGSQFPGIWGNDLQTVLQTGSDPNQNPAFASQNFQCTLTILYFFIFVSYSTMIILINSNTWTTG